MISNSHHATTRAIRHAQSAERFARAISKFAPRQNKSDPTRTKLREHMLDFHTTLRAPRNINIENDENNVLPRFRAFFCRGLQQRTAPATKNEPKANRGPHFVRACAVEIHMDISEEAVYARIYNENAADQDRDNPAALIVCEPAQSKCTWTSHKGTFMREFTAKMPWPRWSTLI